MLRLLCLFHSVMFYRGSYNKVSALNFDNGVEAIARIPTALAGAPFFTTASEVATLEFVREVLGIRAPRVFAWSADATSKLQILSVPNISSWRGCLVWNPIIVGRILRKDLKCMTNIVLAESQIISGGGRNVHK